jgi:hypothetical protein
MRGFHRGLSVIVLSFCVSFSGMTVSGAVTTTLSPAAVQGGVFGTNGRSVVTVIDTLPIHDKIVSATAGGFYVKDSGNNKFTAWCLDIYHWLQLPYAYKVKGANDTPFTNTNAVNLVVTGRLANIKTLFEVNYSTLKLSDNDHSAGFQLALWELVYETSPLSFGVNNGNGTFFASSASVGVIEKANDFLGNLNKAITQSYKFTFYESAEAVAGKSRSQNLVSATPIPLPPAALLFGGAVLGLGYLSRRRKAAKTA